LLIVVFLFDYIFKRVYKKHILYVKKGKMFLNFLKNRLRFLRVRDLKGGEAGAKWSVSGMKHGSEAHPGKARRQWVGFWEGDAGTPKLIS